MSCQLNISELVVLVELAWTTVEEARKIAGEHDELTNEIESAYSTLDHLKSIVGEPKSVINKAKGGRRKDLESHIRGCRRHLRRINSVLTKFGATQDGTVEPWHSIQIENRAVKDISKNRLKLSTYVSAITLTLHLLSLGHQGGVERELSHQRGEAKRLRASVNLLLAKRIVLSRTESRDESGPLNSYDEKEYWRSFVRELVDQGFESGLVNGNKSLIKAYVKELEQRGVVNDGVLRGKPRAKSLPSSEEAGSDRSRSTSTNDNSLSDDFDGLSIDEDDESKSQQDTMSRKSKKNGRQQSVLQRDSNRSENSSITDEKVIPNASSVPTRASVSEIEAMERQETSHRSKRSFVPSPPPTPKKRLTLSVLLFSSKQKPKRASQPAAPPSESRKRQKRSPPPPRPSSPTPDPPAWWVEERLCRRPPGFERGRSPAPAPEPAPPSPPLYFTNVAYSRTIYAYPETSYQWQTVY